MHPSELPALHLSYVVQTHAFLWLTLSLPQGKYMPLIEVQDKSMGNIMGVVTSSPEEKTTTRGG